MSHNRFCKWSGISHPFDWIILKIDYRYDRSYESYDGILSMVHLFTYRKRLTYSIRKASVFQPFYGNNSFCNPMSSKDSLLEFPAKHTNAIMLLIHGHNPFSCCCCWSMLYNWFRKYHVKEFGVGWRHQSFYPSFLNANRWATFSHSETLKCKLHYRYAVLPKDHRSASLLKLAL